MTLLIIFGIIALLCAIGLACLTGEVDLFIIGFFLPAIVLGIVFVSLQGYGVPGHTKTERVTYSQPIASLGDGKGIQGKISGGLFMMTGYINDTQHFAYYRTVAPGSYVLEKRDAAAATIHTDATPKTARVAITDDVATCKPSWWLICDTKPKATFVHADFHVPPNSIKNEFKLDANRTRS